MRDLGSQNQMRAGPLFFKVTRMRSLPFKIAATAMLLASLGAPSALAYPDKPVTIIVAVAAGASPDIIARILGDKLTNVWKQQVVIVNRPGGGGIIAAQAAAAANPDGYTLYMPLSSTFVVLPESKQHGPKLAELFHDLLPVGLIGEQPMAIAVSPSLGVATLTELIALAKRRPGELLYGASRGSVPHMTGELVQARADIKLGFVPTTGAAKVVQDVLGGNLSVVIDSLPSLTAALESGGIKGLAIATNKRLLTHPDLPTVSETLPGVTARGWFALMAPAKTPENVVQKIGADLRTVLNDPDLKRRFEVIGTFSLPATVEETRTYINTEQELWRPTVRAIGVD